MKKVTLAVRKSHDMTDLSWDAGLAQPYDELAALFL